MGSGKRSRRRQAGGSRGPFRSSSRLAPQQVAHRVRVDQRAKRVVALGVLVPPTVLNILITEFASEDALLLLKTRGAAAQPRCEQQGTCPLSGVGAGRLARAL